MNVSEFIAKWRKAELKESAAAQEHFIDLCRTLDHPTPAEADPTGEKFCFEKGAEKHGGGDGYADVWKKDFFGWEYKGKHKDLVAAYNQLLLYRDSLENPPLLVVCDLDRIIVHTNFTNTVSITHEISLEKFGEPRNLEIIRAVFFDPEKLKPGKTSEAVTQEAAEQVAGIAEFMRKRGIESEKAAHFLDRIVFCQFAEDVGLLPEMIFSRIVEKAEGNPVKFGRFIGQLFEAMKKGGEFGLESIKHFNGSLFDEASVPDLTEEEVKRITETSRLDWSAVDPSIFGTLFERGLDPDKRSQIGAHFTGKEDIEILVEAVVMQPLRKEWNDTREIVENLLATGEKKSEKGKSKNLTPTALRKARMESESLLHHFLSQLQRIKVLDPACGSGNFLYVTLQKLKDLEKEAIVFAMEKGMSAFLPLVGPWQLYGIEINPYAYDLAQMTVWIGWLQWIRFNGFGYPSEPILRPMEGNFQCKDAILDLSDPKNPKEPDWPKVDFIVGNPPFLGSKFLRRELGDDYVDKMLQLWNGRVTAEADLCCYWFEKARAYIEKGRCKRAGLLATQGIRGGANRKVLKRIKETGDIFWAIADRDWILDGANVHVSMVAFDNGIEETKILDGKIIRKINSNLSSTADITKAESLLENKSIFLRPPEKGGAFELNDEQALELLQLPNPHGRPNSDVIFPWVNAETLVKVRQFIWTIDFPPGLSEAEASHYEAPFEYILKKVRPEREKNRDERLRRLWWIYRRSGEGVRSASKQFARLICTPRVSKYRLFVWIDSIVEPDTATYAFARDDDFFFGVLHSRIHEVWSRSQGTQVRERESGFRYTPTSCFETFPLPKPNPEQGKTIADAARELNDLRKLWLNPTELTREEILEFHGTAGGPWDGYINKATVNGKTNIGLVRYPRLVPKDEASSKHLQKRTLTQLYNDRPTWLDLAHRKLDEAVFMAYGWDPGITDDQILAALLELNLQKAGKIKKSKNMNNEG
ncbi:MAG: N-6 DNA methylase [Proteobacteria bacterium]|nr:N-6 DNA methylase [Pseudomonadota bacterium]